MIPNVTSVSTINILITAMKNDEFFGGNDTTQTKRKLVSYSAKRNGNRDARLTSGSP